MEPNVVIYPPNKPLERNLEPSKIPVLYDTLNFIESNTKGEILIGSSNVSGTYWEGTLFHYRSFTEALQNAYLGYFISNSTISDAVFLNDDTILLAEDNGYLTLLKTQQEEGNILSCQTKFARSHKVEKISNWGSSKAVTCYDSSISLFNIQEGLIHLERCFKNYHIDLVNYVDTSPLNNDIFASCSMDRKACIWDIRMEMPASVVYQNEFSSLTSVAWSPTNENHLVVGSDGGDIYLIDTKQPKEFVTVAHCFDSPVHRTAFSNSGKLAVCGDVPNVLVYKYMDGEIEKVFENEYHSSVVRGLAWHNDLLFTCGADRNLFEHTVS